MVGFYRDNFGITSGTFDLEAALRIKPQFTLAPFVRFYSQTASNYFSPYGLHDPAELYYTSDYDLSKFQSYKAGIAIRYVPFNRVGKPSVFNEINLQYAFFKRTDQLFSHIITMAFSFSHEHNK
jgi:hypothetical protein